MGSINSIVQQKNIAPHINLGVDNAARVKSYLIWLPFVGLSLRCLFSPHVRLPKKKKNYVACTPRRISPSTIVYQRKMRSVTLLNDSRLTVFSSGSWSPSLSLPLHLPVPSIAHLSRSLPWAGHFVLVLAVSSSSPSTSSSSHSSPFLSSSSSLPGPSVGDKLFVGMHWRPRAAHSCTQRTSIDPACGST